MRDKLAWWIYIVVLSSKSLSLFLPCCHNRNNNVIFSPIWLKLIPIGAEKLVTRYAILLALATRPSSSPVNQPQWRNPRLLRPPDLVVSTDQKVRSKDFSLITIISNLGIFYKLLIKFRNVIFNCRESSGDVNQHSRENATCTVECPEKWKPTITEINCSCSRPKYVVFLINLYAPKFSIRCKVKTCS